MQDAVPTYNCRTKQAGETIQELRPIEKKALLILQRLPEDRAENALSYLEFLQAQQAAEDAKWDALFGQTTDEQWDKLIAEWNAGEATGIDVSGDELKPAAMP